MTRPARLGLLSTSRFAAHFLDTLLTSPPQKRQLMHWEQTQVWRQEWVKAHLDLMIIDGHDQNYEIIEASWLETAASKRPPLMIWASPDDSSRPQSWDKINPWQILQRPFHPDAMLQLLERLP